MRPLLVKTLIVGTVVFSAYIFGQCNASKSGELKQQAIEWKAKADSANRKAESLLLAAFSKDSLLKEMADSLARRKVVYRNRVDSIRILPQVELSAPPEFALVDTAAMHKAFAAADSVIAMHEQKDSVQEVRYALLKQAFSWKEEESRALNRRIAVDVKRMRSERWKGRLEGVAGAIFGGLAIKASQ